MKTKTAAALDLTARELEAAFRDYRRSHKNVDDYSRIIKETCSLRWPFQSAEQCCRDAFCNSLARADEAALRDIAADPDTWVTTHPNGDLFAGSPYEMPRMFVVDGARRKYWEISLSRAREFYRAREQAKRSEATAYEAARREAERCADAAARMVSQCDADIAKAVAAGLNPDEVMFAKVD